MSKKKKCKTRPARTTEAMPEIRTQEPTPLHMPGGVELEYREGFGYTWPPGVERPGKFHVRAPVPCPECDRVSLDGHKQAVMCRGVDRRTGDGVAYLICNGCGHDFKMPILTV